MAHNISFAVKHHRSRGCISFDGVDQNDSILRGDLIDQVQSRGPQVRNFDAIVELITGGQKPHDVRPDAVISQQDVSDSSDQDLLHSTFTLAIWRPDGSNA